MNPVRRSALALAAVCGATGLAPVIDAAASPIATTEAVPSGPAGVPANVPDPLAPLAAPPAADPIDGDCATSTTVVPPATSPPVTTTVPVSTDPGSTVPPATVPPATVPPATVPPSTDPSSTVPPGGEPCATTTTTTVSATTVGPSTTVAETAPTTAPPATTVAAESTTTTSVAEVPSAVTTIAEVATATATAEPETPPAEGAGTPSTVVPGSPIAPIPPIDLTWTTQGVPRFVLPRVPGSGSLQGGRTPAGERVVLAENVDVILATIRQLESREQYGIGPNRALASGAYQYIPTTWNGYGGYAEAYLAPPEVQDERARLDVERILSMYGGDVSMVPVMWYYPRAAYDPQWMDRVPNPGGGNRLTIREYQTLWIERLTQNADAMLGTYVAAPSVPAEVSVLSGLPEGPLAETAVVPAAPDAAVIDPAAVDPAAVVEPAVVDPAVSVVPQIRLDEVTVSPDTVDLAARSEPPAYEPQDGAGWMRPIVFPVLGPVAYADGWMEPRDGGRRQHEGTDIIGVQMQPILAAVDGVVTRWQPTSIGIRGVAITIRDSEGWGYNYFHGNDDTPGTDDGQADEAFRLAPGLEVGSNVVAGQIIGYLGDSGNAEESVSHLHFELRDPDGLARPSYWSLRAAEARQACTIGIGPWSTPNVPDDEGVPVELGEVGVEVPLTEAEVAADGEVAEPVEHTVVTPLFGEGQWVIDSDGRVTATGDAALILPRRDLQCDPGPATPFGTDASGWAGVTSDVLGGTVLEGADLSATILDDVIPDPVDATVAPPPVAAAPAPSGLAMLGIAVAVPPSLAAPVVEIIEPQPSSWSDPVDWAEATPVSEAPEPYADIVDGFVDAVDTVSSVIERDLTADVPADPYAPLSFVDAATGETIIVLFEVPQRLDPVLGPR